MAAVGEGFAGFGREGPEAGVGGVAEGVEVGLVVLGLKVVLPVLVVLLWYGGAVGAYEEFVVVMVAGDVGGVAGKVCGFVWRQRAGECSTFDCELVGSSVGVG